VEGKELGLMLVLGTRAGSVRHGITDLSIFIDLSSDIFKIKIIKCIIIYQVFEGPTA